MGVRSVTRPIAQRTGISALLQRVGALVAPIPAMGWLIGAFVAVLIEFSLGAFLAQLLGMTSLPALFGFRILLTEPVLIPSMLLYLFLVYVLPTIVVGRVTAPVANRVAAKLLSYPLWVSVIFHLTLLYAVLHMWGTLNDYRVLLLRLIFIAIMVTVSLNVVNGYLGEFSCSHPGFMALGAYGASVVTVLAFSNNDILGSPLLPVALGHLLFPIALIVGGLLASVGAILVAIPSFRTRGDYLAIISLAFMFIVKSLIENLEIIGGARGFMGQPQLANLFVTYVWMVLCVAVIYSFVRSIVGKALCAVRDDEMAASAMTVKTRRTKFVGIFFAALWAGVDGGLLAHVVGYINPGSFGVLKLAEVLAMVYLGGLNSVVGSIAGAVGLRMLMELLRPLEILKWLTIPTLVILVMIFRPRGLISFTEVNVEEVLRPKNERPAEEQAMEEVERAPASD